MWYKNIEDPKDQIVSQIFYERPQNYDWSIRAFLVDQ